MTLANVDKIRLLYPAMVLSFLTLFAVQVDAYRAEVKTMLEGERITHSEICLFPASGLASPVERFMASRVVECLDGDKVLDIPPGLWNFYAVHPDGYTSASASTFSYSGPPIPEKLYKVVELEMLEAATLNFGRIMKSLNEGEQLYIHFPSHAGGRPVVSPRVWVPAGEDVVWMIAIPLSYPTRAGFVTAPAAGTEAEVPFEITGERNVLASVALDHPATEPADLRSIAPPFIGLAAGNEIVEPVSELPRPFRSTWVYFQDVRGRRDRIVVNGEWWQPFEAVLEESTDHLIVLKSDLRVRLAGRLRVSWDFPRPAPPCGSDSATPHEVVLKRCRFPLEAATCVEELVSTAVRSGEAPEEIWFDSLPPGKYKLLVDDTDLGPKHVQFSIEPGEVQHLEMGSGAFVVDGRLTERGEPFRGLLQFANGRTHSDRATGRFTATLPEDPGSNHILIYSCDGELVYVHTPELPLTPDTFFNIDIQGATLEVRVGESVRGNPIEGASVIIWIMKSPRSNTVDYSMDPTLTEPGGVAVFKNVPDTRPLKICAEAEGYEGRCVDIESLENQSLDPIAIALDADDPHVEGHILSRMPIREGVLYRTRPDGTVIESVSVESDGRFRTGVRPGLDEPEHAVLVSANLPLVLLQRLHSSERLEYRFPAGVTRNIEVIRKPPAKGQVEVAIGGFRIPHVAFTRHQAYRGQQALLLESGRLVIPEVLETGILSVTLGPWRFPGTWTSGQNPFASPAFAWLPRGVPDERGLVVFDER